MSDYEYEDDFQPYGLNYSEEVQAKADANVAYSCSVTSAVMPNVRDPSYRQFWSKLSSLDKFKIQIDQYAKSIHDTKIKFNVKDRNTMCEYATNNVKNVDKLNAVGFVLGYWLSDGGTNINDVKWKQMTSLKKNEYDIDTTMLNIEVSDSNVCAEDVIRYARYWMKIISIQE